jgi:hypothetical protein
MVQPRQYADQYSQHRRAPGMVIGELCQLSGTDGHRRAPRSIERIRYEPRPSNQCCGILSSHTGVVSDRISNAANTLPCLQHLGSLDTALATLFY